jgi:hypothetical protein
VVHRARRQRGSVRPPSRARSAIAREGFAGRIITARGDGAVTYNGSP